MGETDKRKYLEGISSHYVLRLSLQTLNHVPVRQTGGQLLYSLVCDDIDKVRQ